MSEKYLQIDVIDTGEGFLKEKSEAIFERYFQGDTGLSRGYGIGLSHCKDLVEAHQGFIKIYSEKGEGTKVSILLPERNPVLDKRPERKEEYFIPKKQPISSTGFSYENLETKNSQSILIVEDDRDLRKYLLSELSNYYYVLEASDGVEGEEMAIQHMPDLIISDVMMPKKDGIKLCESLKSNIETSHIPIILLTARSDNEAKFKGLETGADDYISKPFEIEYLLLRIRNLIRTREQLRNLFQKNIDLSPSAVTVTSQDERIIRTLMTCIEEAIPDSEFSINTLEEKLGMSHTKFYNKIKSLTGMSGKDILLDARMKRAHQLFTDNNKLRVSEVAFMVGYTDPKYFSKCFKEKYGIAPSVIANQ